MPETAVAGPGNAVDGATLRVVMGGFVTGVAVVTSTGADGDHAGMTVNSLTSLSLDPPLVLVCLTRQSRTLQAVRESGRLVINILSGGQQNVSSAFASRGGDHFAGARFVLDDGMPVLSGGLAHLACSVHAVHEGGDHEIVVARVLRAVTWPTSPLVFFRGRYRTLGPPTGDSVGTQCWYA